MQLDHKRWNLFRRSLPQDVMAEVETSMDQPVPHRLRANGGQGVEVGERRVADDVILAKEFARKHADAHSSQRAQASRGGGSKGKARRS
jgi:hypothetical protein